MGSNVQANLNWIKNEALKVEYGIHDPGSITYDKFAFPIVIQQVFDIEAEKAVKKDPEVLLEALKTVDGEDSGLDSDMVDPIIPAPPVAFKSDSKWYRLSWS
jgi:hypothetical protein